MTLAAESDNTFRVSNIAAAFEEQSVGAATSVRGRLIDQRTGSELVTWVTASETSSGSGVWLGTFDADKMPAAGTLARLEAEVTAPVDGVSRKKREYLDFTVSRSGV